MIPPGAHVIPAALFRQHLAERGKKKSKYHNERTAFGGVMYDSREEAEYAAMLAIRQKAGDIVSWKRQVNIKLKGENGSEICTYRIDFEISHKDGTTEFVEVKGFETPAWKIKWALLQDKVGDWEFTKLTLVKGKDNGTHRGIRGRNGKHADPPDAHTPAKGGAQRGTERKVGRPGRGKKETERGKTGVQDGSQASGQAGT